MKTLHTELGSPLICEPTDFGLSDVPLRQKFLNDFRKRTVGVVGTIDLSGGTLEVKRVGTPIQGYFYAEYENDLVLCIKYKRKAVPNISVPAIVQVALWKSKSLPITNTFSTDLFFGLIMESNNGIIMSDQEHTQDGREFWTRRLREALRKGLNVYLLNFGDHSLTQVISAHKLEELVQLVWGSERKHQYLRWVICTPTHKLQEK